MHIGALRRDCQRREAFSHEKSEGDVYTGNKGVDRSNQMVAQQEELGDKRYLAKFSASKSNTWQSMSVKGSTAESMQV
jgi:hypothetical protein